MEYDRVLADALRLTWRYKFLWVFALLGGGSSSSSCGGGGPNFRYEQRYPVGQSSDQMPEELRPFAEAMQNFPAFWAANAALILAIIGILVAISLVFFVLSFIARGALISSVARISLGEMADLSSGWQTGLRLGWRYFGLSLLVFILVLGFFLGVLIVGGGLILFGQAGGAAQTLAIIVGVLLALAGIAIVIVFMIALGVISEFGECAIAIDDLGPAAALGRGYDLLKEHFWQSALIWLISVAVAIAAGIALAIPGLIVAAPLGAAVFGAYATSGLSTPTIVAGVVAATIWIPAMWFFGSVAATYGSVYWTLSYLMLTGRYPPPPPAPEIAPAA